MILNIREVNKVIRGKILLDAVNLQISEGKITTILGKSGAGKSILLKSVVGLFTPDNGEIWFHNTDLLQTNRKKAKSLRKKIGYLFQHAALFDFLTVEENIAFSLRECMKLNSKAEIARQVQESLEWVNLETSHALYPHELSGGMQKRVAVARTLVLRPELFLFDEPTTGLDPELSDTIMQLMARVNRDLGISCVIISHDVQLACKISHRIAFIEQGRILFTGTTKEFINTNISNIQTMLAHTGRLL